MIHIIFLQPAQNSDPGLESKIRSASNYLRLENNIWLVVTDLSPKQWRDELMPYIRDGSTTIISLSKPLAGTNNLEISEWLKNNDPFFKV
jgi:hypothetical protein